MRLFQYERKDCTVSVISAENKEEAIDILKEFDTDVNPENILPLKNLLLKLAPSTKQGNICWGLDDMGFNTILELPMLESIPKEESGNGEICDVIELSEFLR